MLRRFRRVVQKAFPYFMLAWAIAVLYQASSMLVDISAEPVEQSTNSGDVAVPQGFGKAGLRNTGHLWCCHGPGLCHRPPFLSLADDSDPSAEGLPDSLQPGECRCEEGYEGDGCLPRCSGCHGHGKCRQPFECECDELWGGEECGDPVCPAGCGDHGVCVAADLCECVEGYTGKACEESKYCGHGAYIGSKEGLLAAGHKPSQVARMLRHGKCACEEGWQGPVCEQAVCREHKCIHGACVEPETCHCHSGWGGPECNVIAGKDKFFFTEKDLPFQQERVYKDKQEELKRSQAELKRVEREKKEMAKYIRPPPWKPSWQKGGKVQGKAAPKLDTAAGGIKLHKSAFES